MLQPQKFYLLKLNQPAVMTENLCKALGCIQQAFVGQHIQLTAAVTTFTVSY